MKIVIMVRGSHHQGIPTFECEATNWEQANRYLTEGLNLIRNKNQFYIERYESYNALTCGIIDFVLTDEVGTRKGQFSFSINNFDKPIEEVVKWYFENDESSKKVG